MADFGFQFLRQNTSVAIDSSNKAGVYLETLTLVGNQSGSKVYTDVPAGALYYIVSASDEAHTITVGNDGTGQAKISWVNSGFGTEYQTTTVAIFARRISSYDVSAALLTAAGDYLADLNYPVPQFRTTISSNGQRNPRIAFDGQLYEATYPGSNYDVTGTMFMLNLPDSTDDDLWYAFNPYSGAYKELKVYVYSPRGVGLMKLPSVHSFSLKNPVGAGVGIGMQCFTKGLALTYDSSAENLAIKDVTTIVPNGSDARFPNPVSYTLALPITCGVVAPFYKLKFFNDHNNEDGSITEYYLSLYQRKGNTFNYMIKLVAGSIGGSSSSPYAIKEGTPKGGGGIFADISQLNPPPNIYTFNG
jgi:hypothetical protein